MRFGLTGFPLGKLYAEIEDAGPARVVAECARVAEETGYDFVCGQDHIVVPRSWVDRGAGAAWFDPFVTLAWAAGVTTRLRFLTDVLVLPYRSPFEVAKAGATLDTLSEGRLILGVAVGHLEEEFRILRTEFERRGAWTDEAIAVIKAAWENEWFSHDGEFFSAQDVTVAPRPTQAPRPPIWVGGNSVVACRRAVRLGDGWTPFASDPARLVETITAATGKASLPEGFAFCVPLRHVLGLDGEIDVDGTLRQIEELAAIGVTHLKVRFEGPKLERYIGLMRDFAERVIARF